MGTAAQSDFDNQCAFNNKSVEKKSLKMKLSLLTLASIGQAEKIEYDLTTDGQISSSNQIGSGITLYKEWELSVDLKLRKNRNWNWSNVFALQQYDADADDKLAHGDLGDRVPAVFMHGGAQKLHICNSVNGNWNYCYDTDDVGTGWNDLVIRQTEEKDYDYELITKEHTSNGDYNYQVVFDNADEYDAFYFDADLPHDAHIGFSATTGHDDKKIEIVLGGWGGLQSVIRSANQEPAQGHVKYNHTKEDFDGWKGNVKVTVSDGKVEVEAYDEVVMSWSDPSIVKSELKNLLVSGGWQGSGKWHIDTWMAPKGTGVFNYEILLNGNVEHTVQNKEPAVWRDVRAEAANGWSNGATKGVFKNFALSTIKPKKELPPVETRIYKLQDLFDEILDNSNLRQIQKQKFGQKFQEKTDDLIVLYEIIRDRETYECKFPNTWKVEVDDDDVDRYAQDNPCKAVNQMVTGAHKWALIFGKDCKREAKNPGTEYNMMKRMMKKVQQVGQKVQNKMGCTADLVEVM